MVSILTILSPLESSLSLRETPLDNEEVLLKVCDENDKTVVPERTTFRFADNQLLFKREVNGEVVDSEIQHAIEENKLHPMIDQSWSEVLFYGLGNKNV
jgi:hypothetical protein